MKKLLCRCKKHCQVADFAIVAAFVLSGTALGQTTAFTYQGKLTVAGSPANASYDMQFSLYDTPDVDTGTQQGPTITTPDVQVTSGIFSVPLDFGAEVFNGSARYLEIGVRPTGSNNPYKKLSPRQPLTTTPYSVRSMNASAADALSVACVNCVTSGQIQSIEGTQITGAIPVESVPTGSGNYIQNSVAAPRAGKGAVQEGGFDISGDGTVAGTLSANIVNAGTQYNIGGSPVLSLGSGIDNLFVGAFAGQADPTGSANSFFGTSAGFNNSTGTANSFFGRSAGFQNTTGGDNSFFGVQAGRDNSTGGGNSFFGRAAGMVNSTGAGNSFFGWQAGGANTTAVGNSFYGDCAGCSTTTGSANSFFGTSVALQNVSGSQNSFFGFGIGGLNTNGIGNSFFGYNTAQVINLGSGNSFFGSEAGQTAFTSVGNSLFGYGANLTDGIARSTAIGISALVSKTDSLVLGAINGVNGATFDTLVGIGTTAPQQILHVNGSEILSTGPLAGFKFRNRGSLSSSDDWVLYSQGNIARLFNQVAGDLMTIRSDGVVSIGGLGISGTTPLCRNGSNQISTCSSSLRYKNEVESFFGGMEIVNRLRPIRFVWKDGGRDIGFAAEEVEKIEPLLTFHNDKGEIEGVKYSQINAVLVNAMKEQQTQINQQQRRIDALTKLICQSNPRSEICH